jgi:hypothetical protein
MYIYTTTLGIVQKQWGKKGNKNRVLQASSKWSNRLAARC